MGVDTKKSSKPPLPAPTDTDELNSPSATELATELSRATDKTSYSIPEDGSPVTISTRKTRRDREDKDSPLTKGNHQSQTSLLIEYFEGSKDGRSESRRPSVRVKVTPSSHKKGRNSNDHIQITESKGTRKPSYTKRISLSPNPRSSAGIQDGDLDDRSLSELASNTTGSNVTSRGEGPIEIEVMPKRHGSPLIPTADNSTTHYTNVNASDLSSVPANSFLDNSQMEPPRRDRSRSLSRGEAVAAGAATGLAAAAVADTLHTPTRRRSRSLSRERIAHKAAEKVRSSDKHERRRKHSSSKSRSESLSHGDRYEDGVRSPRRRSSRSHQHEESLLTADSKPDSSLLSSQATQSHASQRSDGYSFRSGTSKSSISNPKLLETVEDAIRRLILPELTALKREQSKHANRSRRGSITSGSGITGSGVTGSGISRDDSSKVSYRTTTPEASARPKVMLNDNEVLSESKHNKLRKPRKSGDKLDSGSERSFERGASEETVVKDGENIRKKRSNDRHHAAEALVAGGALGALTAAALHNHDPTDDLEKKERRRRRTKSRSRSDISVEELERGHDENLPPPPMPMMSDINASDLTRTSILSAETERPNSASDETRRTPVKEVPRGVASPVSLRTPTRTPVPRPQPGLGMHHNNYSSNNLSLHSPMSPSSPREQRATEYELDEKGRKVPMNSAHEEDYDEDEYDDGYDRPSHGFGTGLAGTNASAGYAAMNHNDYDDEQEEQPDYYQNQQSVPPPLRYVPYSSRRALSPIPQSVVSYREDESEIMHPNSKSPKMTRDSHGSYSSLARSAQSNSQLYEQNKHDFPDVRQGGLTDSEITQDGDYWEEQHQENDRNRDMDEESYHTSDPRYNHKHSSYTDSNASMSELSAGQNLRGVGGGQPDYVHPPGVESAVASLVDASVLTGSTGQTGSSGQSRPQFDRRGSYASYEEGSEAHFTSRGNSPTKQQSALSYDEQHENDDGRQTPTRYNEEYDLDEKGRKVAMPNYEHKPSDVEPVLAVAAAAAIAGRLANRHTRSIEEKYVQRDIPGAPLEKSFADRALENHVPNSPRHSIDRTMSEVSQVEMGASGVPDAHDPMPEIGYGDNESEVTTNPSIIQGPIGGQSGSRQYWNGRSTPTQNKDSSLYAAEAALVGAAAGAGASAAIAEHNRDTGHHHVENDDEWQRTDEDRKRDTIDTNPYIGMSPVPPGTIERDLLAHGIDPATLTYHSGSPTGPLKDEGYISSAPNPRSAGAMTPESRGKGVDYMQQDPFFQSGHKDHLDDLSRGLGSPLYDSATGNAMDRIQSKDIVALLDHLTVRDAQRSARDTEILVTLVRSAAEMRNSFEDMKRLLADTEDVIITEVKQNTDRSVQKVINGPRPFPGSAPRSLPPASQDGMMSDITAKRRNVFRRALKGLSMKSSNDLAKIERMLVQLLGEVEGLKVAQGLQPHSGNEDSYSSMDEEEYEKERGYEPEGHAGTSSASHASQSGHFSAPKSRNASANRPFDSRKVSDHRISTVPEGNEEELSAEEEVVLGNQFEHNELLSTPKSHADIAPGSSAPPPLATPPNQSVQTNVPVSLSNENTPTTPKTDKSKKHKSSSSSGWIPKISRWSETTVSTVAKGFRSNRSSKQKEQLALASTPPSRSGSALGDYGHDPYGDDKLHTGFSSDVLNYSPQTQTQTQTQTQQLGDISDSPSLENPKYKAHRNSINLLHPQPRPGPTHRYQTALEHQADTFPQAPSVKSLDWGSSTSINRLPPNANRYANSSPVSEEMGEYDGNYGSPTELSPPPNQGPARPPKEPLEGSSGATERASGTPRQRNRLQKQSPLSTSDLSARSLTPEAAYIMSGGNGGYQSANGASPRSAVRLSSGAMLGVPGRKPGGPRSMSTGKPDLGGDTGTVIRREKRDTFGGIAGAGPAAGEGNASVRSRGSARSWSGESETF